MAKKHDNAFVALVILMASCAAEEPGNVPDTFGDQFTRPDHINEMFRQVGPNEPTDLFSSEGQIHMQTLPAVGREDRHAAVEDWFPGAAECEPLDQRNGDVMSTIVDLAADTRIVIINEAHDRPQHREFTRRLAIRLAPLGFTHFAAEAFDPETLENDQLPYARTDFGTYVKDPVFGSLVRTAKDLGLVLVAYDAKIGDSDANLDLVERVNRREERQASRLAEVIAAMPESERILIHAGYSHAAEVPIESFGGNPMEWMAARLKRHPGIDPLTIDQTDCQSDSDRIQLAAPSPRHAPGQHDLMVAHPALTFADGRPEWRAEGAIAKVAIPSELVSQSARTIVEARYVDEPMDAVPIDRVMLWPGESLPLLLPAGSYLVTGFHEGSDEQLSTRVAIGRAD